MKGSNARSVAAAVYVWLYGMHRGALEPVDARRVGAQGGWCAQKQKRAA